MDIYCKKCGAKNNSGSKFCINCGAKLTGHNQTDNLNTEKSSSGAKQTRQNDNNVSNEKLNYVDVKDDTQRVQITVGVVLVILFIIAGIAIYHSSQDNKMNNRSAQDTADMAQNIADDDFGSDEIGVWYSKSDNTFTIKVVEDSDTDSTIEDNIDYDGSQSETSTFVDGYQTFIDDLEPKMGSDYKDDYEVEFTNPENGYRYLLNSTGTDIKNNYLDY